MAKLARTEAVYAQSQGGSEVPVLARPVQGRAPLWRHFRAGQLLELSGRKPGKLSTVARLIAHAQLEGEPVAWVTTHTGAGFYPPDFVAAGVELAALVVVRIPMSGPDLSNTKVAARGDRPNTKVAARGDRPNPKVASGAHALLRASEVLLRSGAFGLLVVDFGAAAIPRGELAWQARLSGLVRMHEARAVLLTATPREAPSLGPLIALRIEPEASREGGRVVLKQHVLKCKLGEQAAEPSISPDVRAMPLGAA